MADGLRERKKQRTREVIVREAFKLFRRRGFDATTVADIAAAADIAPRTFFAYFDTKEAVVFHDFEEIRERFAARLGARAEDETTFDALRAWVHDWLDEHGEVDAQHRLREKLIATSPTLHAREREHHAEFVGLIAASVGGELGLPADSLRPRMVGAAAMAALEALDESDGPAASVIDEALVFLQAGVDALRRTPAQ
jgi:AcrR family transcriptional regulator